MNWINIIKYHEIPWGGNGQPSLPTSFVEK
jgi:hypothetical protein